MPIGTNFMLAGAASAADGPWNDFKPQAAPAAAPAPSGPWDDFRPASAPTGVILGRPKQLAPLEQEKFQLQVNNDQRADAAATLAAARDDRAQRTEERAQRTEERAIQTAANATTKLSESEGKTSNFYNSAKGAEQEWKRLDGTPATHDGTLPAGMGGDIARAILPTGLVNSFTSPARQQAQQAKENFIRASLRLESGAAIGKDEFNRQDTIFYPQTGDSPETIAQKERARQQIIEGFRIGAGTGAAKVDALRGPGDLTFNDQMPETVAKPLNLTPGQEAAMQALAMHGGSVEEMAAMANSWGGQVSPENLQQLHQFYSNPKNRSISPDVRVDNSIKPVDPGDGATGAFARGVGDAGTLGFLDELGAAADTLQNDETYGDNLDRRRGLEKFDEEQHGTARTIGQIGGGLALPVGEGASLGRLAATGAGYGAAYGVGSADGGAADRVLGGVTGAASGLAGAAAGIGIGKVAGIGSKALARIPAWKGAAEKALPVVEAAERQGVPITVADASPGARGVYSALESIPMAGGKIGRDLTKGNQAIERRVAEVGGSDVVDQQTLGETMRKAGTDYVGKSKRVVDRAYDIARQRSGGQQITPTQALKTIDDHIAELGRAPETNAEVLTLLGKYRADMVDANGVAKPLDLDVIRGMRSGMRGKTNTEGLRGTDAERRVGQMLDGASQDIDNQLTGGAKQAWQRGDRLHKGRVEHIDRVVETFIGGKGDAALSAEQIANNVTSMAGPRRGDAATLQKMMSTLKPDEQSKVASTLAAQLGRRGDEAGENAFSSSSFFSQLQKYSPAARKAIWGDQGAKDLADLAKIAEQRGQVLGKMNNSASGRNVNFFKALGSVLAGAGAGSAVGAPATGAGSAVAGMAGSYLTAKVLGSKTAVSALAYAARANTLPKQGTAIRRLAALAAKEPTLSADLMPVKEQLEKAWIEDHRKRE